MVHILFRIKESLSGRPQDILSMCQTFAKVVFGKYVSYSDCLNIYLALTILAYQNNYGTEMNDPIKGLLFLFPLETVLNLPCKKITGVYMHTSKLYFKYTCIEKVLSVHPEKNILILL